MHIGAIERSGNPHFMEFLARFSIAHTSKAGAEDNLYVMASGGLLLLQNGFLRIGARLSVCGEHGFYRLC